MPDYLRPPLPLRFKLLLKPPSTDLTGAPKPNIPKGLTVDDIFVDFLRYMKGCVKKFISTYTFNGGTEEEETVRAHELASVTLLDQSLSQTAILPFPGL